MSLKNIVRMARINSRITPKIQGWLVNNPSGVHIQKDEVAERVMQILKPEVTFSVHAVFRLIH